MKYVLDAPVGIKWVMNENDSAEARQLLDDFRSQSHKLIAPDSSDQSDVCGRMPQAVTRFYSTDKSATKSTATGRSPTRI
jgi:hypothetical protein